ncbi:MAG TPA: Ppx/GppA phosphatase family protein [Eubacteriales bacterium]|nr:Ppx/GppA phosphatase family protein [Eubacteriales bacterium]
MGRKYMERVGLFDLGSNTARLVIYDVYDGGYFVLVNEMREAVRLGETERDGNLKPTRILQAINTIKSFKRLCTASKTDRIIAVATAAVRNAKNQKSFLNEMFAATGVKFQVLTEDEEATYDYTGVINTLEAPKGLIFEIGGGSMKLIYYNRRNVLQKHVLDFGSVSLAAEFVSPSVKPEVACQNIENFVKSRLEELPWLKELDPDTQLIGVGGSARSLARIAKRIKKYPLDMVHNFSVKIDEFDYIYNMIKPFDLEKASKIKGLSATRADVFPCALATMKALLDYLQAQNITVCGCGVREGIMFNYAVPTTIDKPISDVLGHDLRTFIKILNLDETHADQMFNLCVQLFKQLRVLHKFPRAYVKVLRIASMMYDAGKTFKFYNYRKHTSYMILHSNLFGASHRDIVLAAYVCDMYSKEEASLSEWAQYKPILSDEDYEAVKKLAVILRLAEAFDKSNAGLITEINCDVLGDSVIMKTEVEGDAALEIKEANSIALEFKKVFKKNLEIL